MKRYANLGCQGGWFWIRGEAVENALIYWLGYPDVAASPDVSFVRPAVDFRVAVSSLLSRIPE